jgi:hypothetical protein
MFAAAHPEARVWILQDYDHVEAFAHPEYEERLRSFSRSSEKRPPRGEADSVQASLPHAENLWPGYRSSIRARRSGSVKSFATMKAPASSSLSGSWVEAMPTVGMPAPTAEAMPETESSKARASPGSAPSFFRAAR